jgi:hypothetical protein
MSGLQEISGWSSQTWGPLAAAMPHIAQGIKKINLRVNEHGDITHKSLAQKGKGKGKKMAKKWSVL